VPALPAVQHQHGFARRLANRGVVQPRFGHDLAGVEAKVLGDPIAFFRRGIIGRERGQCENAPKWRNYQGVE